MHVFARDYVWKSATRVKTQLDIVQLLALDSTRVAVFYLAKKGVVMKAKAHNHDRKISPVIKTLGLAILIVLGLSIAMAIGREMAKPQSTTTSGASTPYAYTELGKACAAAVKNYDAHISDLKKSNDQINASLDKATQATAGNTDPSISASYNSIATNASNDIAQNNTKIDQLSDRRAQVSVCVDKANSQESFTDSDVSNFRTLIAQSAS